MKKKMAMIFVLGALISVLFTGCGVGTVEECIDKGLEVLSEYQKDAGEKVSKAVSDKKDTKELSVQKKKVSDTDQKAKKKNKKKKQNSDRNNRTDKDKSRSKKKNSCDDCSGSCNGRNCGRNCDNGNCGCCDG